MSALVLESSTLSATSLEAGTGLGPGEKKLRRQNSNIDHMPDVKLSDVLKGRTKVPLSLNCFRAFLDEEDSLENLKFWLAVDRLRKISDKRRARDERREAKVRLKALKEKRSVVRSRPGYTNSTNNTGTGGTQSNGGGGMIPEEEGIVATPAAQAAAIGLAVNVIEDESDHINSASGEEDSVNGSGATATESEEGTDSLGTNDAFSFSSSDGASEIWTPDELALYSSMWTTDPPKTEKAMAKAIVNKFLLDQAGHWVNIDDSSRQKILRVVEDNIDDYQPFFDAQKELYNLMLTDTFPRFKRRAMFTNIDGKWRRMYYWHFAIVTFVWIGMFLALLFSSETRWARIAILPLIVFGVNRLFNASLSL